MARTSIVVDAEPGVRTVVIRTLQRAGYVVHETGEVQTALQLCETLEPALSLTNVFLPGITGHDALSLFKMRCPDTPVLMVSGLPDSDVIQHWIPSPFFRKISSPK